MQRIHRSSQHCGVDSQDKSYRRPLVVGGQARQRKRHPCPLNVRDAVLHPLIANAFDIIIIVGQQGDIRYQSPSARGILGYTTEEALGVSGFDFVHPDDAPEVLRLFAKLVRTPGGVRSGRIRVRHRDGSWRHLDAIGKNLLHDPLIAGIVIRCRDITEPCKTQAPLCALPQDLVRVRQQHQQHASSSQRLRQLRQRLQALRKSTSDFLHELRNPLATMRAQVEIALLHPEQFPWSTVAAKILDELSFVQRLAENTFALAQMEEQTPQVSIGQRRTVDMTELITSEIERLSDSRVQTTELLPTRIVGNPDHLRRLLRNLLENAIRYAKSEVRVALQRNAAWALLIVEDDGPGIAPSERTHIFERFRSAKRGGRSPASGPGLGLAIVQDIVASHDGKITVSASSCGGARFEVAFHTSQD
jgi:PAS domain S-box-containing protein